MSEERQGCDRTSPITSQFAHWQGRSDDQKDTTFNDRDIALPMERTEQLGWLQWVDNDQSHTDITVEANIAASIHKNMRREGQEYACFNGNYMACHCYYSLFPYNPRQELQFMPLGSSTPLQIAGFAMCVSAFMCADENDENQMVKIRQFTRKRYNGPVNEPTRQAMDPKTQHGGNTSLHLGQSFGGGQPLQQEVCGTDGRQTLPTEHLFDRIRLIAPKTHRRKRGVSQHRYRLVVELWGEVNPQGRDRWVKVAIQKSVGFMIYPRKLCRYQKERRQRRARGGLSSAHGDRDDGNNGIGAASTAHSWQSNDFACWREQNTDIGHLIDCSRFPGLEQHAEIYLQEDDVFDPAMVPLL